MMTTMALSERQLVTFRGGFVADWAVVSVLLDLEARGGKFYLLADGHFRVDPPDLLTGEQRAFLRAHRDEARAILEYTADDSHLFSDQSQARTPTMPARRERTV